MSHRMSPKTRVVFKFIFGLGIWSFLVLGFFKLNGDPVTQHQFQQTPINGRLLLNKDNRWTGNEATSTTTDRYASPVGAGVDEVLVDNRAGKSSSSTFQPFQSRPLLPEQRRNPKSASAKHPVQTSNAA